VTFEHQCVAISVSSGGRCLNSGRELVDGMRICRLHIYPLARGNRVKAICLDCQGRGVRDGGPCFSCQGSGEVWLKMTVQG
jgi:hypothetical protein